MNTLDCILARRSVRKFKPEKLSHEVIGQIIDHAKFAPSWAHTKTARFICVENDTLKNAIADVTDTNAPVIKGAPNLFVITAVTGRSGTERDGTLYNHTSDEWTMFDAGLAAQTLCLAATELGVATVIMGGYRQPELTALLEVPDDQMVIAIIPAGYPDETPVAPKRKGLEDLLRIL